VGAGGETFFAWGKQKKKVQGGKKALSNGVGQDFILKKILGGQNGKKRGNLPGGSKRKSEKEDEKKKGS